MQIVRSRPRLQIQRKPSGWWSVHTHSRYSVNDALSHVDKMVERVVELGQPALGLTDHGNMAGSVELYKACMKAGIKPFPGSEVYWVPDIAQHKKDYANKKVKASRYHMGVVAYTTEGYRNLVRLSTLSHQNHFHKPLLDYELMAGLAEQGQTAGLALTTGCHFGYLSQTLINQGEAAAKQHLAILESWFPDSVYVEIQNHNIDHDGDWNDDKTCDALVGLADQMGLPVVITQDSHYIHEEDRADHEALKRLVAFGPDPDDAVFPGDGFHLADDEWIRAHHGGHRLARGLEGLADLLGRHTLRIPVLDSYSYSIPRVVHDPQTAMEERASKELAARDLSAKHKEQLDSECEIISDAGMAGYMVLVSMVTDWLRDNDVLFQTRGSAAGSLVCWLLGISTVDPLKWDLRFERFISRDRTKPPDVDLDIAHDRRQDLIDWLDTKFVAHQIGSWGVYGIEQEDKTFDADEDTKGSLLVRYFSTANKRVEDDDDKIHAWSEIPHEDRLMLKSLSDRQLYKGMGTNAAGIVLTSTRQEFDDLVPLAYMPRAGSKSGFVTQYHKDHIEDLGLVKLDVLGSKTLTVMKRAMDNLGLKTSQLEEIEFKDAPTYGILRSGQTQGIFQYDGKATMWGSKDLKPSHIKDVIAAMALFRPAAMNTGGTAAYIRRKHREEPVPERHDLLASVLKPTYGVLLYQEQVIDILRTMGMDPDNLTKFLKAVKASNKNIGDAGVVIKGYQAWIDTKCDEMGFTPDDKEFLDDAIAGFAEYGFNRAHATVYGITAYRCAYLAARHPVEFHAALLAVAAEGERKKHDRLLQVTRRRGVKVLSPALNVSGATYTFDARRGAVRKGLLTVDGVGLGVARAIEALYPIRDLADLVERAPARPISGAKEYDGTLESFNGVLGKLRDAGLLTGL